MQKFKAIIGQWIDEEAIAKDCQVAGVGISPKNEEATIRERILFSVMDQIDKMIERNSNAT